MLIWWDLPLALCASIHHLESAQTRSYINKIIMSSSLTSSQKTMSETPATSPFPETSPAPGASHTAGNSEDVTMAEASQEPQGEDPEEIDDDAMAIDEAVMSLPLSKIKKIFKMDPDYFSASQGAVFATGAATELFVQYFMEHAAMIARMEKRKKIQYKDLSNVVSTQDALHFLSDTVPKTQPVGQAIKENKINLLDEDQRKYSDVNDQENPQSPQKAVEEPIKAPTRALPKGQQTLSFEPVKKPTIKKAVIHDLMSTDDAKGDY